MVLDGQSKGTEKEETYAVVGSDHAVVGSDHSCNAQEKNTLSGRPEKLIPWKNKHML